MQISARPHYKTHRDAMKTTEFSLQNPQDFLVQYIQSDFWRQLYLFWHVKTLLISIISELTNTIRRHHQQLWCTGQGVATQVRDRRKWDKWHMALVLQTKANIRFSLIFPPGCPSTVITLQPLRIFQVFWAGSWTGNHRHITAFVRSSIL